MNEWRRPFLKIVAAIVVVELIMVALGMGPEILLVAALGGFLGAFGWFIGSLDEITEPGPPSPPAIAPEAKPGDDPRVRSLRSGIVFSRSRSNYSERLHRSLVDLIDDQLAFAHGLDRANNADAALAVLGPELWAFVHDARADDSVLDPDDLGRIVTRIEQL